MKAITRLPVVLVLCVLGAAVSDVWAANALPTSLWLAQAALAQADGAKKDPRTESDELVARAREAMNEHHWETADSLLKRAEALKVKYGLLHLGDTPAKARKDFEKLTKTKDGEPQRPSLRFAPQGGEEQTADETAQPGDMPADPFAAPKQGIPITLDDPAARARGSLAKGRKELEQGNLTAAEHWCRDAAEQKAEFGPNDDTPDRLMADINAAGGTGTLELPQAAPQGFDATISAASGAQPFSNGINPDQDPQQQAGIKISMRHRDSGVAPATATSPATAPAIDSPFGHAAMTEPPMEGESGPALTVAGAQSDSSVFDLPASNQAAMPQDVVVRAENLLLEARRALAKGDIRQAASFVNQSEKSGAKFPLDGDSPERVKAIIDMSGRVMQRQGADAQSVEARRERVALFMEQAAGLLFWQDFDLAERLVGEAEQVPFEYGPFDPRPADLRQAIAAARDRYAASHPVTEREYNTRNTAAAPAAAPNATTESDAAGLFPEDTAEQDRESIFGDMPTTSATAAPQIDSATMPATSAADAAAPPQNIAQAKAHALQLLGQARQALAAGDLNAAEHLAREAAKLKLPETAYGQRDDNPWLVMLEIQNARGANGQGNVPTSATGPAAPVAPAVGPGMPAPVRPTSADEALPAEFQLPGASSRDTSPGTGSPVDLPIPSADAPERLPAPDAAPRPVSPGEATTPETDAAPPQETPGLAPEESPLPGNTPADSASTPLMQGAAADQQLLARQLVDESGRAQQTADKMRESDPRGALKVLTDMRKKIADSKLDATSKDQLVRRMNGRITDLEKYIDANKPRIELAEKNKSIRDGIDRQEEVKIEIQGKLAVMVDEYNRLIDERRFAEAEVVAKRAAEIAPDDMTSQQLVKQLVLNSAFLRANANQMDVRDLKQKGFLDSMQAVDDSSIPIDDNNPYQLPDAKIWQQLTERRKKPSEGIQRTPKEREIERKLQTDVTVKFENAPLATVINYLGQLAQVNIHIDQAGLAEEGVTSDTPVSIDVGTPIMLKSALGLILEQHNLAYTIKNEVLNITSEQLLETQMIKITYNVADLVIPIPNFTPNSNLGMTGLLNNAYQNQVGYMGGGNGGFGGGQPLAVMASNSSTMPAPGGVTPEVLAQNMGGATGAGGGPSSQPMGFGPGGMGGGSQADFDTLIELITTTIAPTSWDEVGGSGSIQPFPTNLSLVISNTEEVHEQIVDLLDQLRRLQDLQVTIEVRFITLNDSFFERIGVDFDFDINDKIDAPLQPFGNPDPNFQPSFTSQAINQSPGRNLQDRDFAPSATVGMANPGIFSADLDIPFRQGNFELAVPQFGGFDPAAGASMGFAILSDLEAYFFINAAQGDRRSNVLQAPKVTLFNGQQAFVADTSQSPFVISVVPVVGDFAAAQQPVIVVLSEGTYLTVQAVASPDRRFVRLTVVPFFSQIGEVNTFTFTGETSSTVISGSEGPDDDTTSREDEVTTTTSGTTVQLPTFSFLSVATTVSVPDGGSVLLGGVKRLSEGRNEFGVPILNKLPYISRLFKNVGIGRETQSLMMMVTPRIIIQEEEEELLGVLPQQP